MVKARISKSLHIPYIAANTYYGHCMIMLLQKQFIFIHDAILESVTCGDTQISVTNLRAAVAKLKKKNGFQNQLMVRQLHLTQLYTHVIV